MSGSILIVDELSINRTILRARLSAAYYSCLMAATGQDAIDIARVHRPDIILLDNNLPDMSGEDICNVLRDDPATCEVPLILFSAAHDRAARLRTLSAGADDFLTKPIDEAYLLGRLRALLRDRDGRGGLVVPKSLPDCMSAQIILVSNNPDPDKTGLAHILTGYRVTAMSVHEVLRLDGVLPAPDLIVIAHDVVQSHGMQIISDLRARNGSREADICLMLPQECDLLASMALDLGAREVLRLPLDPEEGALRLRAMLRNKARVKARTQALAQQLDDALHDPLTGLHNRRHMVAELWRLAVSVPDRSQGAGAVLIIDLDHFKQVNDRFGHNAGDDVLIDLSQRYRTVLRKSDVLTRHGGEEFVVLLPGADMNVARQIAERLSEVVQGAPCLTQVNGRGVRITASIGMGLIQHPLPHQTPEEFARVTIEAADAALRAAKLGGRNRIMAEPSAAVA